MAGNGNAAQPAARNGNGNGSQDTNTVRLNKGVQQVTGAAPAQTVKNAEPLHEETPNAGKAPIMATEGFGDDKPGDMTQVIRIQPGIQEPRPVNTAQELLTQPPDQAISSNITQWATGGFFLSAENGNNLTIFLAAAFKATSGYTNHKQHEDLLLILQRICDSTAALLEKDWNAGASERFYASSDLITLIQNPRFQPYMLKTFRIMLQYDPEMDLEELKKSFRDFNEFLTKWDVGLQPQKLSHIERLILAHQEIIKELSEQCALCACDEPMMAFLNQRKIKATLGRVDKLLDISREITS
jgi:hypothetical protein